MSLLDLIFPKQCVRCSRVGYHLCPDCIKMFPKSLPSCCICKKLSKNGVIHTKCNFTDIKIRHIKGWYEDREFNRYLKQKTSGPIYDYYLFLISKVIQRYQLLEFLNSYKISPLFGKRFKDINKRIADKYKRYGNVKSKKLCLIGVQIEDIEKLKIEVSKLEDTLEILIITIL
jgi:hypothetical protein